MQMKKRRRHSLYLVGALFLLLSITGSKANIYATDIKINGALTNGWVAPGYPAQISYILNEPATAGVQLEILSGTNVIQTFSASNGQPGTLAGTNDFFWNGADSRGSNVAPGLYSLSITASATGYSDWTNITDDGPDFFVLFPTGIDVNKNTNSLYYGRVFVSDASHSNPGINKFNADGTQADEGGFSTGGWSWSGPGYSPWKICVGADDRVYVDDWSGQGVVLAFDEQVTNFQVILDGATYSSNATVSLSGPYLTGPATNEAIWMTDYEPKTESAGILRWSLLSDGVLGAATDAAVVIAATNSDLGNAPYDVAVAGNGNIYAVQFYTNTSPASNTLLCFPPWTNGAPPETRALWAIGAGDTNLIGVSGVDVDPSGTWAAVAVQGAGTDFEGGYSGGNLTIVSATNGQLVKRFVIELGGGHQDQFLDVAWDAVGNLYATDFDASVWRVYSPPGPNHATTTAVEQIRALTSLQAPELSQVTMTTNGFGFWLHGQPDVGYAVQLSTDLLNWTNVATNFDTAADRFISLPPTADTQDFYRAIVLP